MVFFFYCLYHFAFTVDIIICSGTFLYVYSLYCYCLCSKFIVKITLQMLNEYLLTDIKAYKRDLLNLINSQREEESMILF